MEIVTGKTFDEFENQIFFTITELGEKQIANWDNTNGLQRNDFHQSTVDNELSLSISGVEAEYITVYSRY